MKKFTIDEFEKSQREIKTIEDMYTSLNAYKFYSDFDDKKSEAEEWRKAVLKAIDLRLEYMEELSSRDLLKDTDVYKKRQTVVENVKKIEKAIKSIRFK